MLRRTLYVTSWQVYLRDGSNALIVMYLLTKYIKRVLWGGAVRLSYI